MLVQSLLNTTSLWLDICILDMSIYLNKIALLIKLVYKFLIRLRTRLKPVY